MRFITCRLPDGVEDPAHFYRIIITLIIIT